ncbi:S-adenosyl-L-methionine-dependent methyltransferase [Pilobolus umbonatus]|nr:S-adenosyl-L-methionine-dependent methyltransferase [Pilobolus umbonatus]
MGSKLSKNTKGLQHHSPFKSKEVPIPTTVDDTGAHTVPEKEKPDDVPPKANVNRTFHEVQDSAYWLPNDGAELDRLTGQHYAVKNLFEGNINSLIVNSLEMKSKHSNVLDIGCGPGSWIKDVCNDYPLCQFTGVDMTDVFPTDFSATNVKFELGNVLKGLKYADNTFDYVNIRLLIIALKKNEWEIVIKEVYRLLKPGGFVQWVECGMLEDGPELTARAGIIFKETIEKVGQEPFIAQKIRFLLEDEGFNIADYTTKYFTLGQPSALSREFGLDVINIFKSAEVLLRAPLGYTAEIYPEFLDALAKSFSEKPNTHWSFTRCVAQK